MIAKHDDLDDLKSRIRLSDYVSRRVKLSGGKGDRFGLCPFHDEKSPSFSVNDVKGFYHCFGCGAHGDALDWLRKIEGLDFAAAIDRLRRDAGVAMRPAAREAAPDHSVLQKQAEARAIWAQTEPIIGTLAERYLCEARAIAIPLPDCLRFHPGLPVDPREPALLPALVAAVTDLSGVVVAIQRTFLRPDGAGKAAIERPKRALGPVGQGAVCLGSPSSTVGLAEGIETGLSAMQLFRVPVWCALGCNLARISLPKGVRNVAIFADRGAAGERAAASAKAAFRSQGRRIAVRFAREGKDFNDELKARRYAG